MPEREPGGGRSAFEELHLAVVEIAARAHHQQFPGPHRLQQQRLGGAQAINHPEHVLPHGSIDPFIRATACLEARARLEQKKAYDCPKAKSGSCPQCQPRT